MSKAQVRHMFAGGNTSLGFFSYYDYILPQEEAARIFILKGGPGVGKSTFMRRIAGEMLTMGYDVEFMHCSSDPDSYDGVVIPEIKVAFMDGTAPHMVDPRNPGAVDEIINLGDYWNEEKIKQHKEAIMESNLEIKRIFQRAYRYIKAAALVHEDTAEINKLAVDTGRINVIADTMLKEIFDGTEISGTGGRQRRLFASAITPDGIKNYIDSILNMEKVYRIIGEQGTGAEKILEKIKNSAVERGFYVESYYCALYPLKLEHLVIPALSVAVTTTNSYHRANVDTYKEYDLNEYVEKSIIARFENELVNNGKKFEELIGMAVNTLEKAKAMHKQIESYYIPNMDFEAVQRRLESTLAMIVKGI
ncbi:MAG TPA: ATPase [Clostridiaceae bacterium]|nr:ATPase [Clostridiaceae bacterium]